MIPQVFVNQHYWDVNKKSQEKKVAEKRVYIPCGTITLEGKFALPDGAGPFPAMVVCHPHPLTEGNMDNIIVVSVCQELVKSGVAALRFNFRGIGESGGKYGEGITEQDDVKAAIGLLASMAGIDPARIGLAGYSFGGGVAVTTSLDDSRVQVLVLISAGLTDTAWKRLRTYPRPKMFIVGSDDARIPQKVFQDRVERIPDPIEVNIIPGADHFWWGLESDVSKRVAGFVTNHLSKAVQMSP